MDTVGKGPEAPGSAESQLRIARLALDNSLDSIIIHDTEGRLVYFNEAAAALLGYTPEEFGRLEPWGFAGSATAQERAARMAEIQAAGEMTFFSEGRLKNGERWVAEVRSRWVEDVCGPLVVSVSHDVTDRVTARETLEHLAFHDPLTGLANRALFDDRLEVAIAGATRHGNLLGIAFIDLDGFKTVNDTLGHDVGDQVLITLARRLERTARAEDTVARFGGDEFVIIFPRLASEGALDAVAEKLRARLKEPLTVGAERIELSGSVGLALFDPSADNARTLLMRADVSMYEAKRRAVPAGRHHLRRVS